MADATMPTGYADVDPVTETQEHYVERMNEKERIAYEIAKDHLGSTFDLGKSLGFVSYEKKNSAKK